MKEKQWKDYWDVELGVSYIPIEKLDPQVAMPFFDYYFLKSAFVLSCKQIKFTISEEIV